MEREWLRSEADREVALEMAANAENNLRAILDDWGAENVAALGWKVYKETECGPWLSVQTADGEWHHSGHLTGIRNDDVWRLLVGSIVEGSDATVHGDELDLSVEDASIVQKFKEQIASVNAEACAIWEETNDEQSEEA